MFPPFFEIFWAMMLRLSMQKTLNGPDKALVERPKNGCQTKKVHFFKVRDILAIILPRKKKHLTNVSSYLMAPLNHNVFWNLSSPRARIITKTPKHLKRQENKFHKYLLTIVDSMKATLNY